MITSLSRIFSARHMAAGGARAPEGMQGESLVLRPLHTAATSGDEDPTPGPFRIPVNFSMESGEMAYYQAQAQRRQQETDALGI
jgi:hypothetical protein